MATLQLSLLGPINVSLDDRPIKNLKSKRAVGLLIYLAVESALGARSHSREALMELLWPGVDPSSSRVSLRQTLYLLRRSVDDYLPPEGDESLPLLISDRNNVQIDTAYPLSLDVAEFSKILEGSRDRWPDAAALYRGDFLADFYLEDANQFESWAAARREAFRRDALKALEFLTQEKIGQSEYEDAEIYARRQIDIDNSRESAYRQLMAIFTWQGRRPEALALYEELADLLDREYGTRPDESTADLVEVIREGRSVPPPGESESEFVTGLPVTEEPASIENPYRGLRAFREEDAPFFFGRELFTKRLLDEVERNPLVAVIGPSGSGKSSVIYAGLVPRLRENGNWEAVSFRPGHEPFQSLSAALMPLLESDASETDLLVETRKLAAALSEGLLPLTDVFERILAKNEHVDRLLLVANQFEELYTAGGSESDTHLFLDILFSSMEIDGGGSGNRHNFVMALRTDFMGQALAYRPLADALQDGGVMLGPMTRQELARAVEKPAVSQGVTFEPGLLERILDDVGDEPGNLPLLQFALTALWERRSDGQLKHGVYRDIGGVGGAMTRQADAFYQGLDADQREGARRVLIQMVRPGRQTADTRRVARRSEIGESDWQLVQRLADARLVVTARNSRGQETAELAHEALIRGWDRLNLWMEEDRAFRAWQERLRAALQGWHASDCDDGALLRGAPLSEAESWLLERGSELSPREREYVQFSVELRDRRRIEREKARAARERLRRRIIAGLSAGLLLVTALALLSFYQGRQAMRATANAQQALSRQLATLALNSMEDELDLAYLLSAEAFNRADTFQARNSLLATITQNLQLVRYLNGQDGAIRALSFSPANDSVATGSSEGVIQLWDTASGRALGKPIEGHQGIVISLAFSPDGRLLATAGQDDVIRLWRVSSSVDQGDLFLEVDTVQPELEQVGVTVLAFNPDLSFLVTGDTAGQLHFYDMRVGSGSYGRQLITPLKFDIRGISAIAFSPDGLTLAVGGSDGALLLVGVPDILQDVENNITPRFFGAGRPGHDGNVTGLSFSPDGSSLASGSFDGTVKVWDVQTLAQIGPAMRNHEGWITGVAFTPDGRMLATSGNDGLIQVWDSAGILAGERDREPLYTFSGLQDSIYALAIDPEGQTLISGSAEGKAILWSLSADHPLASRLGGDVPTFAATFARNDPILVTTGGDRRDRLVVWDMDEDSETFGRPLREIATGHDSIFRLAISLDDAMVAAGDEIGVLSVWDLQEGVAIREPFQAHEDLIRDLAFSSEGILVSGSRNRTITLVDPRANKDPIRYSIDEPNAVRILSVEGLAISPDGNILVIATEYRRILRYDLPALFKGAGPATGASLPPLESPVTGIRGVEFTPDGRFLAFSTRRSVYLWSAEGDRLIWGPIDQPAGTFPWNGNLTLSPDNLTLAFGSYNGSYLIDITSGKRYASQLSEAAVFIEGNLLVDHLSFGPNGRFLATSTSDRRTTLWDVNPATWQEIACRRANRNLTIEEWRDYFGDEPFRETCPELG